MQTSDLGKGLPMKTEDPPTQDTPSGSKGLWATVLGPRMQPTGLSRHLLLRVPYQAERVFVPTM